MNCRKIVKLLPELAAGEIDEQTARMADAHTGHCSSCAAELAAHKKALAALASPREMMEVPESLAVLMIPEAAVRRSTTRRAVAVCAVAVCIVLGFFAVSKLQQRPESKTKPTQIIAKPVPSRIQKPVQQLPANDKRVAQSEEPTTPANRQIAAKPRPYQQPKPVRKHVERQSSVPRQDRTAPPPQPELETQQPPVQPEDVPVVVEDTKPVIVVATRSIEPPATIEVTSVDNVTGEWTHFYAVYDNENEQSIEVLHTSIEEGREP